MNRHTEARVTGSFLLKFQQISGPRAGHAPLGHIPCGRTPLSGPYRDCEESACEGEVEEMEDEDRGGAVVAASPPLCGLASLLLLSLVVVPAHVGEVLPVPRILEMWAWI